jgi:hypothetical protein
MGDRLTTTEALTCANCEIEIAGQVTFHVGLAFCCAGCVAGGPCMCAYDEAEADPQIRHCLDVDGAFRGRAAARRPEQLAVNHR